MNKNTVKSIVRHSILTGMAFDTIGHAFESGYTRLDKSIWCDSDRIGFPTQLKESTLTGKSSFNSEFLAMALLSICETNPISKKDTNLFVDDYRRVLKSYTSCDLQFDNPYLKFLDTKESIEPIVSAVAALSYYSALIKIDLVTFFHWVDTVLSLFEPKERDYRVALIFAFTLYRLVNTGYFGYSSLLELQKNKLLDGDVGALLEIYMENHLDADFLSEIDYELVDGLSYFEQLLCGIMFIMLRIDTAYPREILKSLPREQVVDVFTIKGIKEADAGFMFGMMCTASEHKHPLIPKPLREATQYRQIVDSALQYM